MDQGTQQNAALVEEATSASQSMKQQAGALLEQVAFFKTADQGAGQSGRNTSTVKRGTGVSRPPAKPASPKAQAPSSAKAKPAPAPQPVGVGSSNGKSASKGDDDFFEEF